MAETSGFFQAMEDENGRPDRRYLAKQFCDYFALFIGNGVFGNPTNQLIVSPGQDGLSVIVRPGNAFIDGMWYNNSSDKEIFIVPNYESQMRVDTVRVRMSQITRTITVDVFTGDSELQRGEDIYDLQLATINVQPFAETITAANIRDTRPDQSVCGFVTQLMSVQTTSDLFAQYQAQFEEWFAGVKGTLGEDAAGNLLIKIEDLDTKVDNFISNQNQLIQNLSLDYAVVYVELANSNINLQYAQEVDLIPSLEARGKNAYDVMEVVVQYYTETNSYVGIGTVSLMRSSIWTARIAGRFPIPSRNIYRKNSDGSYTQLLDSSEIENPLYSRDLSLGMAGEKFLKLKIDDCYLYEKDTNGIWYRNREKVVPRGSAVSKIALICWPELKKEA